MVFAESREQFQLEHKVKPLYDFLVPFFFVVTGAQVDLGALEDLGVVGQTAVVLVVAVLTKLIGAGGGAFRMPASSRAIIGVGMVPRGEVGLIVASLGFSLGAISADVFAILVLVSIGTTLVVPPALSYLLRRQRESAGPGAIVELGPRPEPGVRVSHSESGDDPIPR
jgi:Kef-type K+ transport system membrane component KefB